MMLKVLDISIRGTLKGLHSLNPGNWKQIYEFSMLVVDATVVGVKLLAQIKFLYTFCDSQ